MRTNEKTKSAVLLISALALPLISLQLFPMQAEVLLDKLQTAVGPTMPFLIVFSFYAFAGLQLTFNKPKGDHSILSILNHTENIAALIIPMGMIGTYIALVQVLSSGDVDFTAHMNAFYSTLIALITYVVVLIGSEFIIRIKGPSTETIRTEDVPKMISKNTLTMQQIISAGFSMSVCLFIYLALASSGIELF